MSSYVLDTGMLVGIIRVAPFAEYAKQRYEILAPTTTTIISIVSIGEIWSLAYQYCSVIRIDQSIAPDE